MNRKYFLSFMTAAGITLPYFRSQANSPDDLSGKERLPAYLKPGDSIGITAPAGHTTLEIIQPCIQVLEQWGFKVKIGNTIGKSSFTFGGTDEERSTDLQQMLDDPELSAILCARGGYGVVRILDQLNFDHFQKKPKWVIGFSDITALHCHLNRNYQIASIHSKMCSGFFTDLSLADATQIDSMNTIRKALCGEPLEYITAPLPQNRNGKGEGILVGGNLSLVETLAGSRSDLKTDGKILFLEDTGEYAYSIDRMLWNLKRSGKLARLKGLIIGGFKLKADDPGEEFGKEIIEIVMEKVKEYDYPVCFDFPVGHQKYNLALKHGIRHQFEVNEKGGFLKSLR